MAETEKSPVAVLGAGSWGTALAIQMARLDSPIRLWGRDAEALAEMQRERRNVRYLPDAPFPDAITVEADFEAAVAGCRDIMISVPSHSFGKTAQRLAPLLQDNARVFWATKGLADGRLLHEVAGEILGDRPFAVVSGPTFAKEVGAGMPAAIAVAATDDEFANDLVARLHGANMRAYTNDDIIGVQIGGAAKNVMAVGAGIADGLQFGANTRAALITRGIAEVMRLGEAFGAKRETFMGLAGIGDLILTCTDDLSRNRRMGLALARGLTVAEAEEEIQQVVEGVGTAAEVWNVAQRMNVEMPITQQVYSIIHEGRDAKEAVMELLMRKPRREGE